MSTELTSLLETETAKPVDAAITAMALGLLPKHQNVLAILAYGSTLRDVKPDESLIDLYVLTETAHGVSSNAVSRIGCALVPPNVYYAECAHQGKIYRAKYAALPRARFQERMKASAGNPYFWARFAQPCRIVWAQDEVARTSVLKILGVAAATAFGNAKALAPEKTAQDQWIKLFQNTYRTELRPEAADRAENLVLANADYYATISKVLVDAVPIQANWSMRRIAGKTLSVLRLAKASFTFQGGADYIAWKIKRHSGVEIAVTDWHRRHPLLAGLLLLPKLLGSRAIK